MEMSVYSRHQCVQCDATDRELAKTLVTALAAAGVEVDKPFVANIISNGGMIVKPAAQNKQIVLVQVNLTTGDEADEILETVKEQYEVQRSPFVITDERQWTGFNLNELRYFMADVAEALPKMDIGSKPFVINIYKGTALALLHSKSSLMTV